MAVLTVFLAPNEGAGEILDVLHDLSGAGLVERFLWLPGAAAAGPGYAAVAVAGGRRAPTSLQDVVVDERHERIRVCVLVPLVSCPEPLPGPIEQEVGALIAANAGGAPVTRIRLLLTRGGVCEPKPDHVAHEGWHNVFVAPELSAGPGGGRWVLPSATSADEAARQLAPSVAGITGLWTGAAECPLDLLPMPGGRSVRAGRSFYRRVEAGEVEAQLRAQVLTTRPELPLPRQRHGASITYLADSGGACATMASHLWERHGHLLAGPRSRVAARPEPVSGPRAELGWFPGYLLAAARDDPKRWYAGVVARLREAVPHQDQARTFEALPSGYTGIVHGAGPDGRPLGWDEIGEIADQVDAALPPLAASPPPDEHLDLPALWRDYAGGALTLADAGDRGGQAMPPAQTGSGRGVLQTTESCVPGLDRDFVPGHGNVAARAGIAAVQAGDVLGADVLRRRLARLAQDRTLAADAEDTRRALDGWEKDLHATYVYHVGTRLGTRLAQVGDELRGHLTALSEAVAAPDDLFRAQQRRQEVLSRVVLGVAAGGLTVLLVTIALMAFLVGAAIPAIVVAVLALLAGTGGPALVYGIGQRRLFRELRHRQALIDQVEAEQPNLRRVLRDYRRLRDTYADFLLWSRALAAVLEEPFGPTAPDQAPGPSTLRELPPSARIGHALVDQGAVPEAVTALRGELFVTGWLTGPWQSNLQVAVRRFAAGADGPSQATPEALLCARSSACADPPLWAWSQAITAEGPATEIRHQVWTSVLGSLTGPRAAVGEALLASIRPGDGRGGTPALADFLAGVDRPDDVVDDWFDAAHFSAVAQTEERARVAGSTPSGSRAGLSRVDVLVQLGEAFPAWDLELSGDRTDPEEPVVSRDEPSF